jgi:ABC-2 type transport system ATP-binding protein
VVLSRAMRRRVLGGLPVAGLVAAALACAPAASAKDITITSFDGTKIVAHWFVGKGVSVGQPAPTILEGPGWTMPLGEPVAATANAKAKPKKKKRKRKRRR